MTRAGIFAALLVWAACGSPIEVQPDGGTDADAASSGGLTLSFAIDPEVPGDLFPGATLDDVDLAIKDLRLTGDAASATDDRTRAPFLDLEWKSDTAPRPAMFPTAPPGRYSKIAFKLENDTGDAFRIHGTILWFDGQVHPFEIEDDNGVDISVPMDVTLPVGDKAGDTLEVHMVGIFAGIDWQNAKLDDDGTVKVTSDTDLHEVRDRFGGAFSAASITH
ncbi:MAG TPA: hypothetical protein VL463_10670 [Kofleriaceae bacterium]|nr:hypothetical protein [Kofleriaceae bacterium]